MSRVRPPSRSAITGSTPSSRRTHCAASPERQPPAPTPAHTYHSRMPSRSLVRLWMASCSESYGCSCGVRGEVRVTVRGRGTVAAPVWRTPGRCARPGRNIYRLAEAEGRPELALAGRAVGRIGQSLGMAVTRLHVVRRLARDLQDARRFEGERLDGWPDLTRDLRRAHARGGHGAPRRRAGGCPRQTAAATAQPTGPRRTYWLMSTMATSEREVNRLKASSICGGVVSAGRRARAEVRKGVGASAAAGVRGGAHLSRRP